MAARRLLIVLLVLLGVSTLAAALVPERSTREGDTSSTTTEATTTTRAPAPNPAFLRPTKITIGGKKFPVVSPIEVGDQLRLMVRSRVPAEIEIPEFGLVGFASPDAPALFELLPDTPGRFGIIFTSTGKPAAQIVVVPPTDERGGKGKKKSGKAKGSDRALRSRAPAGSTPA